MTAPMENTLTLDALLGIAKRRALLMAAVFLAALGIALAVIPNLPPRYLSEAVVSVESQQIPEDLVKSTVVGYADQRIAFIQQRVMTDKRLLEIIAKFKLYSNKRGKASESELLSKFRENVTLEIVRDFGGTRGGIVAFRLGFENGNPEVAAAVARELVDMFLHENYTTRTARATETTEFFRQEAARLGEQVGTMEKKVADFKEEHSDELPDNLKVRMNMLANSKSRVESIDREIMDLEQEKRFLETQLVFKDADLPAASSKDRDLLTPAQQLAVLRVEFADKSAIYSPAHPDLKWLKRRIEQLQKIVNTSAGAEKLVATGEDGAKALLKTQIDSAKTRLESLRTEKKELQYKVAQLEAKIVATPQVERELNDLTRDYDGVRAEYDQMRSKQKEAELAENLEAQEKAERFVLLDPPQVPTVPIWPNKMKAYAVGFVLSIGSGAGIGMLAEFLDKSIRGVAMLTSILQRPPLGVVPYIESSADRRRNRARRRTSFLVFVFLLIVVLLLVHFFVGPIDVYIDSLLGETPQL